MKNWKWAIPVLGLAALLAFLLRGKLTIPNLAATSPSPKELAASPAPPLSRQKNNPAKIAGSPASSGNPPDQKTILLTAENFEEKVMDCFRGNPCQLSEDPASFYDALKRSQHPDAADQLISFLRSKLRTSEGRALYETPVKAMIEDYYQGQAKTFQLAAYDDYRGAFEESLAYYQQVEKDRLAHPEGPAVPWMNIANLYFEMKRPTDALPYYQKALAEMEAKEVVGDQRLVMDFLRRRIGQIQGHR